MTKIKYVEERHRMKSGDLLAWDEGRGGILSKITVSLVRLFTGSRYGHVGVIWVCSGRVFVIEASQPHVRITPLSSIKEFFYISTRLRWRKDYEYFLLSKIGLEYSLLDCIRAYLGILNNKDNDSYQCAELACEFYKLTGIITDNFYEPGCLVDAIVETRKSQPLLITNKNKFTNIFSRD